MDDNVDAETLDAARRLVEAHGEYWVTQDAPEGVYLYFARRFAECEKARGIPTYVDALRTASN
jgi:hypothetical protein